MYFRQAASYEAYSWNSIYASVGMTSPDQKSALKGVVSINNKSFKKVSTIEISGVVI